MRCRRAPRSQRSACGLEAPITVQSVTKEFSVLLLDFGGVCSLYPVELHRHTEASFGLPRGSLTWLGPVAPDTDPLWQELLADRLTERGYWDRRVAEIGEAAGRSLSVRDYMSNCYSLPEAEIIRPEAVEVVSAARQAGMKIGILTNDLEAFVGPGFTDKINFFRLIDSMTDVSHAGILKPDPRAYQRALADLGAEKPDVFFVDDQPGNIAGAQQFGIATMHFDMVDPVAAWAAVRRRILAAT